MKCILYKEAVEKGYSQIFKMGPTMQPLTTITNLFTCGIFPTGVFKSPQLSLTFVAAALTCLK